MAKRRSITKHDSSEVQGEGSFVVLSGVKVKEMREARKQSRRARIARARRDAELENNPLAEVPEDDEDLEFEGGIQMLTAHIVDWNWVDDDGNPLPLPKERPNVVDELTNEESEFLVEILTGSEEAKN